MNDPWLAEMRHKPEATLFAIMPKLRKLTGEARDRRTGQDQAGRPLHHARLRAAGVVLVGDAFATSCPAAGTGTSKVFTDVERLCNVYIPRWLETEGMSVDKIAAFYDDPVKRACDKHSHDKAFNLRAVSIEPGLQWRVRRLTRFLGRLAIGKMRQAHAWLSGVAPALPGVRTVVAPSIVPASHSMPPAVLHPAEDVQQRRNAAA